jgi:hypothetical protein
VGQVSFTTSDIPPSAYCAAALAERANHSNGNATVQKSVMRTDFIKPTSTRDFDSLILWGTLPWGGCRSNAQLRLANTIFPRGGDGVNMKHLATWP